MDTKGNKKKKSMKRLLKHKIFRFRNIFSLTSLILTIVLMVFLFMVNILPTKYIVLVSMFLIIIDVFGTIFINVHKKIGLKIIGFLIIILSIIGSCVGIYYLSTTNKFLNNSFTEKIMYDKNTYYVLALKSNGLKNTDINGEIAVYKDMIYYDKAIDKLNDKFTVSTKDYDDIGLVFDNVINNTNKFMLVEKSSYEIVLSISSTYKKSDFDILYEFDIYTKKNKNNNIDKEKFNIYVGANDDASLRDFNMIVSVNTKTHKVLLTSIPRDYYIEVPNKDGRLDKLSFMSAYGYDTNKEALEKLFNTTISYSVRIDVGNVDEIVDFVGGVDFCSDYEFNVGNIHVVKGCQHLNGYQTVRVARHRNSLPGRDRIRQENCRKIIVDIFKKLVSTDTMLHYNEALNNLSSLYETDIPKEVISEFSKDILNNGNRWKIESQSVDGVDGHDKVHLSNMVDWVMYPDQSTVDKASKNIKEILK